MHGQVEDTHDDQQDEAASTVTGSELLSQALLQQNVQTFFYLMGGPMLAAERKCLDSGIRGIDVRHEQAAAMMAHAYARLTGGPGVCMACSGPGAINLVTGLAHAMIDCTPVVAIGGSSPVKQYGKDSFQEIDQVAIMRPAVKWAERVYDARRIPALIARAFREAISGKPGPVYLDLPGDVLYQAVPASEVEWETAAVSRPRPRPMADEKELAAAIDILKAAEKPIIISGSGILWSDASEELERFVDQTGIPFYTTPQGRGVVPEDHQYCYLNARSTAFRDADAILVLGTRLNYVINFGEPPRINANAKIIRVDIDHGELASSAVAHLNIAADAKTFLRQFASACEGQFGPDAFGSWRERLAEIDSAKKSKNETLLNSDQTPIHPLRLCKEVSEFLERDGILVVDGQEILNFGRQAIPTFTPGHRLNSGTFGTMGVGLPFGIGAKLAKPDNQVVVLHGDGSFAMNGMELDTAVRHQVPVITVISLNGGWTADPDQWKPGRDLGYTRYHEIAQSLGCHAEYVEKPQDIQAALERAGEAAKKGIPAVVSVLTDWRANATTAKFSLYST